MSNNVIAQESKNRIWFTWEAQNVNQELCEKRGVCRPISEYLTRLVEEPSFKKASEMTGSMDRLAKHRKLPVEHPEQPLICQNVNAMSVLGFDPESWPISEKIDALRGLEGVFFSVASLKAPEGYEGPFGEKLQATIEKKFDAAGIPILTEEEMEMTPGKPHLNVYFSNTNPDTGCWFSVFASLTQTMLLTRNHTVKVKAGSWGFSGGYSADNPDRAEFDAILLAADRFVADFTAANPGGVQKVELKP